MTRSPLAKDVSERDAGGAVRDDRGSISGLVRGLGLFQGSRAAARARLGLGVPA